MQPLEEMGKFATVVIDPPWPVSAGNGSAKNGYAKGIDYRLMDLAALVCMPIRKVMAEDAWLFCWTVNKFLSATFQLLTSWHADYVFTMTWAKNGGVQLPNRPQYNAEWVVVGRRGNPQFKATKAFNTLNFWRREGDSKKPEEFYDLLRRVTPAPRLDIFGRRHISGFDSWGDQAPAPMEAIPYYQEVLI